VALRRARAGERLSGEALALGHVELDDAAVMDGELHSAIPHSGYRISDRRKRHGTPFRCVRRRRPVIVIIGKASGRSHNDTPSGSSFNSTYKIDNAKSAWGRQSECLVRRCEPFA
jgi:hypothetical protein